MKMKTDLKFLLPPPVLKKPINYLKDSQLADQLKLLLARVLGILILVCSEINLELYGRYILILNTKAK